MNYKSQLKNPIFKTIQIIADELDYPTFIVGGWVRDLLLNRNKILYRSCSNLNEVS